MSIRNRSYAVSLRPFVLAMFLLSVPRLTSATEAAKYVSLRAKVRCDRQLTYADVLKNGSEYTGRILELTGTVNGTVGDGENLTVLLNLKDGNSTSLDIPSAETAMIREASAPSLRVLVKVEETSVGNVAPLKVLALAHETEVAYLEQQEAARKAALRERERQATLERHREEARQFLSRGTRASLPSRKGVPQPSAISAADLQTLSTHYAQYLGPRVQPLFMAYLNFIARHNRRLSMNQAALITASLLHFADRYNVDPRLVVAMIIAESDFDPRSTSRTGAMGLGQLMPGTAKSLGVNNPYDIVENMKGSIAYLRGRLDNFAYKSLPDGGLTFDQVRLAMAAYNAGTGAVKKYRGVPPYRETQAYVRRIESIYRTLIGDSAQQDAGN